MNNNFFDRANSYLDRTEYSIVNFLTALSPWLAPVVPASLVLGHLNGEILKFNLFVSISGAIAVWALGFATLRTSIIFWNHNRKYTLETRKMPLVVPIGAFIFYLGIVLVVNILLELPNDIISETAKRVSSVTMLSLMEVPAGLLIAVRATFAEVSKKVTPIIQQVQETRSYASESSEKLSVTFSDWRKVPEGVRKEISQLQTWEEVKEKFCKDKSDKTAQNWFNWSRKE